MDRTCKIKENKIPVAQVLWYFSFLVLVIFIFFPLLCVFSKIKLPIVAGVFLESRFRKILLNTLIECISSTILSVLVGYIYAYAVVFGKLPFKKFFASLPLLHLVTPPFVGGLAFILLLGRQGLITKTIFHLDISLYGFPGLLIAQVLCFFPLSYMICKENLESLSEHLFEAARSMGVSKMKIFFKVTLPLSFPSLISSFLFIAVSVLSDFGNPMIVGGRFKVLAVEIYTQLTGWMNVGTSASLGLVLLIPSMALFFLQNRLFKKQNQKNAVLGGKNFRSVSYNKNEEKPLNSKGVSFLLSVFVFFLALCILLQFVSILAGSFQKLWGIDTRFTFQHLQNTFKYKKDFVNSVSFAFIAATLSVIIAAFVSYIVHRKQNFAGRKIVDSLIQIPSAVPGSLLGLAFSIAANILHFKNPVFLIVSVITISFMPFSYRIISSSYVQIKMTQDEGAQSLGAGILKVFGKILVPLAKGGISSGWVYNFARGVGTLSSVVFLVSFNTPLCSVRILNLAEQGDWGRAAAMAMELTLITFAIIGIGNSFFFFKRKSK